MARATGRSFEQTDLSEGTYPEGSVWRPVGKYLKSALTLRKDSVVVPSTLAPGDYVIGWRWDGSGGNQVNIQTYFFDFLGGKSTKYIQFIFLRSGCLVLQ